MTRVLVTGAGGFIGRELCAVLVASGHDVVALVRPGQEPSAPPGTRPLGVDLRLPFHLDSAGLQPVDAVVHLAQPPWGDTSPGHSGDLWTITAAATARLAEWLAGQGGGRLVLGSSGGVYVSRPTPLDESAPVHASGSWPAYFRAKLAAEDLLADVDRSVTTTVCRYFFVYGPGQHHSFLLPRMLARIEAGDPIPLGEGRGPRLNPIHVADAAAATARLLEAPATPAVVNVAGAEVCTLRSIVDTAAGFLGRSAVIEATADQPHDLVADISRLGEWYRPVRTLDDGLAELCRARSEQGVHEVRQ